MNVLFKALLWFSVIAGGREACRGVQMHMRIQHALRDTVFVACDSCIVRPEGVREVLK